MRTKSYIIKPRPQKPIVANAITGLLKIFTLFVYSINLKTGFSFRNYYFLTLLISLANNVILEPVYIDTGCSVSLIDWYFLRERYLSTKISLIISLISVRNIGSNYYFINKYIFLTIFLPKERNGKPRLAKIIRKLYLADGFKAKILINMDIISLKIINIIIFKK